MASPNLRRRFNYGLAFWVILLGAIGLAVAVPLDRLNLHPVVVDIQTRAKMGLIWLAPFLLVAALGAGVGLAELSSTFSDYPREAIATQWGQYMIWLNAGAAALAFAVARIYMPDANTLLLIISVGAGFPTLIRTKFTLAKQFGGEGGSDLSVNIGWLYEQFQNLCKKQIDLDLMTYRLAQVERLLGRYSKEQLYAIARYTINARATLSKEEETAKVEEMQRIITEESLDFVPMNLALLILEVGGIAYVNQLAEEKPGAPVAQMAVPALSAAAPQQTEEAVVKTLVALPLADLVALGLNVLRSPEDQDWVQKAAAPMSGVSEVRQKAPIAYYIVSHAGAAAAEAELAKRT